VEGAGEHPLPRTNPNLAATILEHALWMSRQGYRPTTIKGSVKTLKALSRRCNFLNPTEFKTYLATAGYSENRKDKVLSDVDRLYKQLGIRWDRPLSRRVETLLFIPTVIQRAREFYSSGAGKMICSEPF